MVPWRREKGLNKARKVLRVWRGGSWAMLNGDWYADDGEIAQRLLRTRVPCSGSCCGNPRRWFGKRTRQELIADIEMQEQLDDLRIDHDAVEQDRFYFEGCDSYWDGWVDRWPNAWEGSAYECMLASEAVLMWDWMEPWPEFDGGGNVNENMSYAAYCKGCGHLCGMTIDNLDRPARTAEYVAEFIRDGMTVMRVSDEVIRKEFHCCTCQDGDDDADQS